MVFDRVPRSLRIDFITDISKENSIKLFGCKQRGTSNLCLISDLKTEEQKAW